jgi:outer membrane putative beta-barrel porin/alpha-amylase
LTQGQVFESELAMASEEEREPKQVEQESDHRADIVAGSEPTDQPLGRRTEFWRRTGSGCRTFIATRLIIIFILAGVGVVQGLPCGGAVYAGPLQATMPERQAVRDSSASESERSSAENRETDSTTRRREGKTLLGSIFGISGTVEEDTEEEQRLDPDRPHFPEASTTVGNGRAVLESGYTFTQKGSLRSHTYPEALLRVGMLADWFEFRIGQNFISQQQPAGGAHTTENGAQDLYLGAKFALMEQWRYLPEIALIPQMTVPTASKSVTAGKVLPGLNVDCTWQLIPGVFNIELLIATNEVRDDIHRSHVEVATGATAVVQLTRNLEAFVEWDAFYPADAPRATSGARDYAVGGLVYFLSKNLAVDVRAGIGLTREANDVLAGTGFAVRY